MVSTAGLAVGGDRFATDDAVRDVVLHAAETGVSEVTIWGGGRPAEVGSTLESVVYRLSRAAQAFKSEALRAADSLDDQEIEVESFYRFGRRPAFSDLTVIA